LGEAPGVGTCWAIPEERLTPEYWFDDSPQVACTEPHTTETAQVYELDEPTVKEASDFAEICWDAARVYVDVNLDHWVPWASGLFLPSRQQIADGASFARCEVLIPANLAGTEFTSLTYSVQGSATERAVELLPCLDEAPEMTRQPFVSCGKPHRYEATGQLAALYVDTYPSPEVMQSEAVQCRDGLLPLQATPDHAVDVAWDPPGGLRENGELAGVCFVYRQDGSLLPARQ
jgi:Septum formation